MMTSCVLHCNRRLRRGLNFTPLWFPDISVFATLELWSLQAYRVKNEEKMVLLIVLSLHTEIVSVIDFLFIYSI